MELESFELWIRREDHKMVVAARSPAGDATAPFSLGESEHHRNWPSEPGPDADLGQRLFEALFPAAVRERYRESLGMARTQGTRLAITLYCDDPELLSLPWELAYDPTDARPLAASLRTPFSRSLSLARPSMPLRVEPPLQLLVVAASPAGYPGLDIEGELQRLKQELQQLLEQGLLQMRVLRHATPEALRGELSHSPHLLHLISHGRRDAGGRVELVLEDNYGDPLILPVDELAAALSGVQLRLAVLMACHSAGPSSVVQGLNILGPSLLKAGVGGVVVLNAELSDQVAIAFSGALYRALAAGEALGTAVNGARQDIWAARRTGQSDWAVPVLFTRDPAGRVLIPAKETAEVKAPGNLPAPPTPLIGRERELEELTERLRQDDVRLITLTGPGGTGKTRLALEVAHKSLNRYRDGAFFVSLASLQDPALAPATIAQALDVHESGGKPILETLKSVLAEREMLLVLDNFEHLMAAARVVAELLAAAPRLNMLTTSRERLRLRGEEHYPLNPLGTPATEHLDKELTIAEAASFPAVQLFRERARAAMPSFEMTEATVPAVATICARLDGLPLAIELAAARMAMFGTAEVLLKRLGSGLKLTGGARDLHEHQRTLQATIEWSYRLLAPEEQRLFRRLAVFVGGRTLEAVEAICNRDRDLGLDVLDGMQALLDKSLLRREVGAGGEPRFVMLQTVQDYALEQLEESGEAERIRQSHADYFLALAEEVEPQLRGPEQAQWFERLETEHNNFRAALAWSWQAARSDTTMRLAVALSWFWNIRGHATEGRHWLESILATTKSDGRSTLRVRLLRGIGLLASVQGDYEAACTYYEEALKIASLTGDKQQIAGVLGNLGNVNAVQGNYVESRSIFEQSLVIAEKFHDEPTITQALGGLGATAHNQGDYTSARSYFEQSLAIAEKMGDTRTIAWILGNLGAIAANQGEYTLARSYYERSLMIAEKINNKQQIAWVLGNLGIVANDEADYVSARSYHEQSLAIAEKIADKRTITRALGYLGATVANQKEFASARSYYERGLAIAEEIGDKRATTVALAGLGTVAAGLDDGKAARSYFCRSLSLAEELGLTSLTMQLLREIAVLESADGRTVRPAKLWGAAERLREQTGSAIAPNEEEQFEQRLTLFCEQLGAEAFATAMAEGREMSLDEAIAYALSGAAAATIDPAATKAGPTNQA